MKENPPGNKASSDGCLSKIAQNQIMGGIKLLQAGVSAKFEQNQILAISAALLQRRPLETAKGMAIEMLPSTFRV